MDASLNQQLSLAAVAMSAAALFFSLIAAFPGLKSVLAAVRDGVLWFSLFLVLGAGGYLAWQEVTTRQPAASTAKRALDLPSAAASPPQSVP
jgi:hypothetical protein